MIITEAIKEIVTDMGVCHFMYGTRMEINKRLLAKKNRYDKYPLIVLYTPVIGEDRDGMMHYDLTLSILDYTKKISDAEKRVAEVFSPVLFPLYKTFINKVREYEFTWPGDMERPPHSAHIVPFWGVESSEGMIKKHYTDPLDAIVLTGFKVNRVITCDDDGVLNPGLVVPPPLVTTPVEGDVLQFVDGKWTTISIEALAEQTNIL